MSRLVSHVNVQPGLRQQQKSQSATTGHDLATRLWRDVAELFDRYGDKPDPYQYMKEETKVIWNRVCSSDANRFSRPSGLLSTLSPPLSITQDVNNNNITCSPSSMNHQNTHDVANDDRILVMEIERRLKEKMSHLMLSRNCCRAMSCAPPTKKAHYAEVATQTNISQTCPAMKKVQDQDSQTETKQMVNAASQIRPRRKKCDSVAVQTPQVIQCTASCQTSTSKQGHARSKSVRTESTGPTHSSPVVRNRSKSHLTTDTKQAGSSSYKQAQLAKYKSRGYLSEKDITRRMPKLSKDRIRQRSRSAQRPEPQIESSYQEHREKLPRNLETQNGNSANDEQRAVNITVNVNCEMPTLECNRNTTVTSANIVPLTETVKNAFEHVQRPINEEKVSKSLTKPNVSNVIDDVVDDIVEEKLQNTQRKPCAKKHQNPKLNKETTKFIDGNASVDDVKDMQNNRRKSERRKSRVNARKKRNIAKSNEQKIIQDTIDKDVNDVIEDILEESPSFRTVSRKKNLNGLGRKKVDDEKNKGEQVTRKDNVEGDNRIRKTKSKQQTPSDNPQHCRIAQDDYLEDLINEELLLAERNEDSMVTKASFGEKSHALKHKTSNSFDDSSESDMSDVLDEDMRIILGIPKEPKMIPKKGCVSSHTHFETDSSSNESSFAKHTVNKLATSSSSYESIKRFQTSSPLPTENKFAENFDVDLSDVDNVNDEYIMNRPVVPPLNLPSDSSMDEDQFRILEKGRNTSYFTTDDRSVRGMTSVKNNEPTDVKHDQLDRLTTLKERYRAKLRSQTRPGSLINVKSNDVPVVRKSPTENSHDQKIKSSRKGKTVKEIIESNQDSTTEEIKNDIKKWTTFYQTNHLKLLSKYSKNTVKATKKSGDMKPLHHGRLVAEAILNKLNQFLLQSNHNINDISHVFESCISEVSKWTDGSDLVMRVYLQRLQQKLIFEKKGKDFLKMIQKHMKLLRNCHKKMGGVLSADEERKYKAASKINYPTKLVTPTASADVSAKELSCMKPKKILGLHKQLAQHIVLQARKQDQVAVRDSLVSRLKAASDTIEQSHKKYMDERPKPKEMIILTHPMRGNTLADSYLEAYLIKTQKKITRKPTRQTALKAMSKTAVSLTRTLNGLNQLHIYGCAKHTSNETNTTMDDDSSSEEDESDDEDQLDHVDSSSEDEEG